MARLSRLQGAALGAGAFTLPRLARFAPVPGAPVWRWLGAFLLAVCTAGWAGLPANTGPSAATAFGGAEQTPLGRLVLERKAQSHASSDSAFGLLDSAHSAFSSRLALIDGAQRSLDLQYYAIHADNSTELLLRRLRDAARRGVRVRILLDDFNTVGEDAQVLRLAFEPNVQIRLFNPVSGSRQSLLARVLGSLPDMARVQKRMHNKLFIADNAIAIVGGRNLGDAYFGADEKSNFIDLEVLALGRVASAMSASFDKYWNDELAYPMHELVSAQDLERLRLLDFKPDKPAPPADDKPVAAVPALVRTASVLPDARPEAVPDDARQPMDLRRVSLVWAPSALMVDQPGKVGPGDDEADRGETVVDGLLSLMQQARSEVLIVSPYFVPGESMMAQFRELRAKGIRIRVLTNSLASNDAPAAHAGYARYREDLLRIGVELHEMRAEQDAAAGAAGSRGSADAADTDRSVAGSKMGSHASLHSKAVFIDQSLAVIGSMNLDLRSQRKNSEMALIVRSTALAQRAIGQIEATLARGAYLVALHQDELVWRAPAGADFHDAHHEPEASLKLRLLARLIALFAPEEML